MVQTRSSLKKKEPHDAENDSYDATEPGLSLASLSAPVDDLEDVIDEDDINYKPAKKRRKKANKAKRRVQPSKKSQQLGKLEMLPKMNLDILFHILSFFHPMDLLNLARTTKAFRQLLMQKSSAFVWKRSRLQLEGFPECPVDLSEPQYINLAFYPHCHNCGKIAQTIYWRIRRRYCRSCREICLRYLPFCDPFMRGGDVMPSDCISNDSKQRRAQSVVDADQLDALLDEYRSLPEDKKEEFVKSRTLQTRTVSEHARECEDWSHNVAAARQLELSDAREARQDDIFNRLIDLGYEFEIDHFGTWDIAEKSDNAIFFSSKALTDREWNRVRPALVETMEEYRERAREELVYSPRRLALVRQYDRYVRNPAPPGAEVDILPHVADVATFEPFAAIINSSPEANVDDRSFDPAFEQLPVLVQEWREKIEAELVSLIVFPSRSTKPGGGQTTRKQKTIKSIDRLKLASAVFTNKWGDTLSTYPDVLNFSGYNQVHLSSEVDNYSAPLDFGAHPWSLYYSLGRTIVRFCAAAAGIVRVCGLDPESATVEDMERRDARLVCDTCQDSRVRTWKNAILHLHTGHSALNDEGKVDWALVDDRYLEDIKVAEAPPFNAQAHDLRVQCLSCQRRMGDNCYYRPIEEHMRALHNVQTPEEGIHYRFVQMWEWPVIKEVQMIKEKGSVKFTPL